MSFVSAACWFGLGCGGEPGANTPSGGSTTGGEGGAGAASSSASSASSTGAGGASPSTCPGAVLAPGVHARTIAHAGSMRAYEVQVPAAYDDTSPVPLVLDIHGYTSSADQQEGYSGFSALAEKEGFIVVRPSGSGFLSSWNGGPLCCGTAASEGLDDVGLMKAIVAEVSALVCVDPRRVYATGLSNGGAMSHRLACEAADVFAAIAPVSWPIALSSFTECTPSRPIAVMHSHGTGDFIVPYGGGFGKPSTPESFAYWGQVDGCTGEPVVTYTKGNSACATYETCGAGVKVTLCTVAGGHVLYGNDDDVPIAELSWQFLSQFALPAP